MTKNNSIIYEYDNEIDAEIAKGHLLAAGISSFIIKDDGGGMIPSLQNAEGVQLLVAESQSENARRILNITNPKE